MSGAIAALRAELNAARSILLPQVQGLVDLAGMPFFSAEAMVEIERELADHRRRLTLIDDVLNALDALEADGYPEMPLATVSRPILDEMLAQQAAIAAAIGEFAAAALSVVITPGVPEDK